MKYDFTVIPDRSSCGSSKWNAVPGARGRAHLTVRKYTNDKGEERTINDVSRFLEPEENAVSRPAPGSNQTQAYQAGRF